MPDTSDAVSLLPVSTPSVTTSNARWRLALAATVLAAAPTASYSDVDSPRPSFEIHTANTVDLAGKRHDFPQGGVKSKQRRFVTPGVQQAHRRHPRRDGRGRCSG